MDQRAGAGGGGVYGQVVGLGHAAHRVAEVVVQAGVAHRNGVGDGQGPGGEVHTAVFHPVHGHVLDRDDVGWVVDPDAGSVAVVDHAVAQGEAVGQHGGRGAHAGGYVGGLRGGGE